MIKIQLNGETKEITNTSLLNLLEQHWQGPDCFAVAINQQFIARTQYAVTELQHGDRVDVVLPMQGG